MDEGGAMTPADRFLIPAAAFALLAIAESALADHLALSSVFGFVFGLLAGLLVRLLWPPATTLAVGVGRALALYVLLALPIRLLVGLVRGSVVAP